MKQRLLPLIVVLIVLAAAQTPPHVSYAQTNCAAASCLYLPVVPYKIIAISSYIQYQKGGTLLKGQIHNGGDRPVYAVALEVRVYDEQGREVQRDTPRLDLVALFPGERHSFITRIAESNYFPPLRYEVEVKSMSATPPVWYAPPAVVWIEEHPSRYDKRRLQIRIQNDQLASVSIISVVVVDSSGAPHHAFPIPTDGWAALALEPGETVEYEAYIGFEAVGPFNVRTEGRLAPVVP